MNAVRSSIGWPAASSWASSCWRFSAVQRTAIKNGPRPIPSTCRGGAAVPLDHEDGAPEIEPDAPELPILEMVAPDLGEPEPIAVEGGDVFDVFGPEGEVMECRHQSGSRGLGGSSAAPTALHGLSSPSQPHTVPP